MNQRKLEILGILLVIPLTRKFFLKNLSKKYSQRNKDSNKDC